MLAPEEVAKTQACHFFDAGKVVTASAIDGVHLDASHHLTLDRALLPVVAALLDSAV